jgi:tetratricopeptide (TPR) repeat protein
MAGVLETRAMVRLKTGDYARALTDYDAALAALPTDALALYGRGLTRLRLGKVSEGQADLAAAAAIQPKVAAQAKAFGLSPS